MKKMSDKGDSASFPDEEKKKKKKKKKKEKRGSSSASFTGKDQSFGKMNRRTLLYQKSLTLDDVTKFKIMIPLESGIKFLAEPEKLTENIRAK
ncbi:hypothetical protein CK203_062474 [Vitis vinifera]|uniref:Uncharacterized protein n=1 Tax=Vitis vinifera TaxID=29760 RepID=A0A438FUC5_VITVI|nr:hypothetical protein CK203_062474 [Vitis vinifera]